MTTGLVVLALVVSVIAVGVALSIFNKLKWTDRMGSAKWDPATSWASTLTAIGALLAIAFAMSAALPAESQRLAKNQYAGLTIFFAMVNVLAPFVYNATRTEKAGTTPPELQGSVGAFATASAMTLWAVLGQL